jgi:hypothetical protein
MVKLKLKPLNHIKSVKNVFFFKKLNARVTQIRFNGLNRVLTPFFKSLILRHYSLEIQICSYLDDRSNINLKFKFMIYNIGY